MRVAPGDVEEHQIGGRIVQKGRKPAAKPEIHRVDRLPSFVGDKAHDRAQHSRGTCAKHRNHGDDGKKDSDEKLGHFNDRSPIEVVACARRIGRDLE